MTYYVIFSCFLFLLRRWFCCFSFIVASYVCLVLILLSVLSRFKLFASSLYAVPWVVLSSVILTSTAFSVILNHLPSSSYLMTQFQNAICDKLGKIGMLSLYMESNNWLRKEFKLDILHAG